MILVAIFAGILLVLVGIWLYLIAPGKAPTELVAFQRPYAHRGLWQKDAGIPENSLPAFEAAAAAGFAMELDVHLSRDGVVVVFHDNTLKRMCGVDGKVEDYTAAELAAMHLDGTAYGIPTFAEVLAAVDGRTPLLVELKGESANDALCAATAALLDAYKGGYVVESFNPLLLAWFAKNRPQVMRGLLVTDMFDKKKKRTFGKWVRDVIIQGRLLNCKARPQFLAWNLHAGHTLADLVLLRIFRVPSFGWTARELALFDKAVAEGTSPIFDSIPEKW